MSAIIYDSRLNELRASLPDYIQGDVLIDVRPTSVLLAAVNAETLMDLNGAPTVLFDVRTAAASLTLVFEVSMDAVNYYQLAAFDIQNELYVAAVVITTTHARTYAVETAGWKRVRVRCSAFVSGNVNVGGRGTSADFQIYARPIPTTLIATATGAANAAVTLTIPAPAAGLFHYITGLEITRAGAAALAGTAVLVITSTNLPGTVAWSVGNASAAGGTQKDFDKMFSNPIKSLVAGTATTIVAPIPGAGVLWRINAYYYLGL